MLERLQPNNQKTVLLIILAFGGVIALAAYLIQRHFGPLGITILDLSISTILTAALVILYFNQTEILDAQRRLFTQQLNRDARQRHTETLRERVKKWHGNPEQSPVTDPTKGPKKNTPVVQGASIQSASNLGVTIQFGTDRNDFYTVPIELQEDPYFEDLLENHAPDLLDRKTKIEELESEFTALREHFIEKYNDTIVEEQDDYRLEPHPRIAVWIFDLVVLSQRDRLYGDDTILDRALSDIENNDQSPLVPDESKLRFHAGHEEIPVYSAVFDVADEEKLRNYWDDVEQKVIETVEKVVKNIDDNEPYSYAREAAEVLDSAEAEVNKLDELLIEYYGSPIYSGDCKYLKEARI